MMSAMDPTDKLTRVRAGLYRTDDERFTVTQSGGAWYVRDGEQTDQLGQPRLAGPYPTLGEARQALATLRSGPGGSSS